MGWKMNFNLNNDLPIYIQIIEYITLEIINGNLKPGVKIPSVREYAMLLKVNPNTISKSLQDLEEKKLIYTERTNGKYVTNDLKIIEYYKKELLIRKVNDFLSDVKAMGYSKEEIIKKIEEIK